MRQAKTLLVIILAMGVLVCTGCRKKQVQQEKQTQDTSASNGTLHKTQDTRQQPAVESPKTITPVTPNDINQQAAVRVPKKEVTQSLKERPKLTMPATPNAPGTITEPTEPNLEQFASLATSQEKINWISEFADAHPEQVASMAEMALNDPDVEVRSAAMDAMIENETPGLAVVSKAMQDKEEQIRQQGVEACQFVDDKMASAVLSSSLADQSELVRTAAMEVAEQKDNDTKATVFRAAIASQYEDVKQAAVPALIDMSNQQAVDILLEGLKDPNPDFREDVIQGLDFLIGQEFKSYDEAQKWWNANRNRFDKELAEVSQEQNE